MRFKQFVEELTSIESGQAVDAHEPTGEASSAITNPKIRMEVNYRLANELYGPFLSPEGGIQAIRKVLHRYGFDMPALYDANPEGDEVVYDLDNGLSIYLIYSPTDDGYYEFYAEVGDEERMNELMSEEDDNIE